MQIEWIGLIEWGRQQQQQQQCGSCIGSTLSQVRALMVGLYACSCTSMQHMQHMQQP
jgi:hypothetical protein